MKTQHQEFVFRSFAGLLLKISCIRNLEKREHHDDAVYWETPDVEEPLSNIELLNVKDSL